MTSPHFNDSKYTRWYFKIIDVARSTSFEGYTERHHIVPKSMGGSNEPKNIVKLSARQHFVCHLLLVKMTSSAAQIKMIYAAKHMAVCHRRAHYRVTSITYERLKRQQAKVMSEKHVSTETRRKLSMKLTGQKRTFTVEHCLALSKSKAGKKTGQQSHEFIERRMKNVRKPVQQFTLDGVLIATYQSVKDAKLATNADVSRCCTGSLKTSKGWIWRYVVSSQ